jgi:hypothetical protein
MSYAKSLKYCVFVAILGLPLSAEPMPVRHVQGYIHGYLVLKDMEDKILASGDMVQLPGRNHLTTTLTFHFKDGSLYQETVVFSQRKTYQLLTYKQEQKGPAFKTPGTFSFNTATKKVDIEYTDKDGKAKTISEEIPLPPDLANGMIPTLLTEADPKVETVLSMLVSTPKPRVVKLKISSAEQDSFAVGGLGAKAIHYVIKIDIGGITGVAAKVIGKQPPPVQMWIAAGSAPAFLKSEGPLFEDGPIWRIELASPAWPKASPSKQ